MTDQEASKLSLALSLGYIILIGGTPYVCGPVTSIDSQSETKDSEGKLTYTDWAYTDDTFDDRPLSEVDIYEVKCLQRVDFIGGILEQQPEDHEFEYNTTERIPNNTGSNFFAAMGLFPPTPEDDEDSTPNYRRKYEEPTQTHSQMMTEVRADQDREEDGDDFDDYTDEEYNQDVQQAKDDDEDWKKGTISGNEGYRTSGELGDYNPGRDGNN